MADKASLTLRSAENVDKYERAIYAAHLALGADPSFEPETVKVFQMKGDRESIQTLARTTAIRDMAELMQAMAERIVSLEKEIASLRKIGGSKNER
jgi:hypothetical protein